MKAKMISRPCLTCLTSGLAVLIAASSAFALQEDEQDKNRQMKGLMLTPKAFRVAAAKVQPSLVTIESFGGTSTVAGRIGGFGNKAREIPRAS